MSFIHSKLLDFRNKYYAYNNLNSKYIFINRLTGKEKYLIVLAGYKSYLYSYVFERLHKFVPEDIDVCIVSSGIFDEKLSKIAEENRWSYLYITKNKIEVAQNIAISINKDAKYIYKMDEDIFVTKGCFEALFDLYIDMKRFGHFIPGFVAPIIPLNGYGYIKILEKYNLNSVYSNLFGRIICSSKNTAPIISNSETAKFFWGNGNYIPNIDKINFDFSNSEEKYSVCPIRFSIGFIMFEKEFWNEMGMFRQTYGSGLGNDESQICAFCINSSRPIVVSHKCVVGHFSFGPQTNEMISFLNSENMKYYR